MSYSCGQMNTDQPLSSHERVLIRLPNWVGDVCMCLPALKLIQSLGIPLAVCARPWAKDILSGLNIESFVAVQGNFRTDLKTLRAWKRVHPEYKRGLLLPDSLSSALLFKLAGLSSAGYKDDGRSLLLKWGFDQPSPRPHALESWYKLTEKSLESWNMPHLTGQIPTKLALPLTEQHLELARQALLQAGLLADNSGQFVLIAPTAVGLHHGQLKVWPHFDALTKSLQAAGLRVLMCPPAAEQAAAQLAAPTAQLLPPLGLGAFAALTRQARLVICNDSGVSHICAAAGAHQMTLFGVTDPGRTGPWSPDTVNLGQNGQWPTLAEVLSRVQQILNIKS